MRRATARPAEALKAAGQVQQLVRVDVQEPMLAGGTAARDGVLTVEHLPRLNLAFRVQPAATTTASPPHSLMSDASRTRILTREGS